MIKLQNPKWDFRVKYRSKIRIKTINIQNNLRQKRHLVEYIFIKQNFESTYLRNRT